MINIITDDERILALLDSEQGDMWCEAISDMVCDAIERIADTPSGWENEEQGIPENIASLIFLRRTLKGLGKECQVERIDEDWAKKLTGDGTEQTEEETNDE